MDAKLDLKLVFRCIFSVILLYRLYKSEKFNFKPDKELTVRNFMVDSFESLLSLSALSQNEWQLDIDSYRYIMTHNT